MAKWPDGLGYGDEVMIIYKVAVSSADADTLRYSDGWWEADDPDLLGVVKLPDSR